MQFLTNGLGAASGDTLVTCEGLITSQHVIWANSLTGNDANTGQNREEPRRTLWAANGVAWPGDIIVLMAGFDETIPVAITPAAGITIVGEGSIGGKPSCKLRSSGIGAEIIHMNPGAIGVELRNIWFDESTAANAIPRVLVETHNARIVNCYFECGANDNAPAVLYQFNVCPQDIDYQVIQNTTFIATAPDCTVLPDTAVEFLDPSTFLTLDGVTFDDGPFGFDRDYAFIGMDGLWGFRKIGVSLLHGASMYVPGTYNVGMPSMGWLNTQTRTGGGRVDWV
jgi:hypothetical protein